MSKNAATDFHKASRKCLDQYQCHEDINGHDGSSKGRVRNVLIFGHGVAMNHMISSNNELDCNSGGQYDFNKGGYRQENRR